MCVSLDEIYDELPFCGDYIYENICVPVYSSIWPEWSLKAKDFTIEEVVVENF